MEDELATLKNELKQVRARAAELRKIIAEKEAVVKGEVKKKTIDDYKREFFLSDPPKRVDPFTDWELVYWSSYLLANTSRREILTSIAEVAKRAKNIRKIVQYYKDYYQANYDESDANLVDCWARNRTKDYLEYVLWKVPGWISKDGPVPMTFYIATSDWAINNYGAKVFSYVKEKEARRLMTPFEEDD